MFTRIEVTSVDQQFLFCRLLIRNLALFEFYLSGFFGNFLTMSIVKQAPNATPLESMPGFRAASFKLTTSKLNFRRICKYLFHAYNTVHRTPKNIKSIVCRLLKRQRKPTQRCEMFGLLYYVEYWLGRIRSIERKPYSKTLPSSDLAPPPPPPSVISIG